MTQPDPNDPVKRKKPDNALALGCCGGSPLPESKDKEWNDAADEGGCCDAETADAQAPDAAQDLSGDAERQEDGPPGLRAPTQAQIRK